MEVLRRLFDFPGQSFLILGPRSTGKTTFLKGRCRPTQNLAHYRILQALPLILGTGRKPDADYLDACRSKRNTVEYDYAGGAADTDASELIEFAKTLEKHVLGWAKSRHSDLLKN